MEFLNEAGNYPVISRLRKNIEYVKNGLVKGAVTLKANEIFIPNLYESYVRGHENEDIIHCGKGAFMASFDPYFLFVDKFFIQDRVLEYIGLDRLREPLAGKRVWCKTAGSYREMMPRMPTYFLALDDDSVPDDGGRRAGEFKPVVNEERTLLELIAFHYKYAFDEAQDKFAKLPAAQQDKNFLKPWLEHEIKRESGSDSARISDYGRLIRFLLGKVALSADEQALFADLLAEAVTEDELRGILRREKKVIGKLNDYRKGRL